MVKKLINNITENKTGKSFIESVKKVGKKVASVGVAFSFLLPVAGCSSKDKTEVPNLPTTSTSQQDTTTSDKIESLTSEIESLKEDVANLIEENKGLKTSIATISNDNEVLAGVVETLRIACIALSEDVEDLQYAFKQLKTKVNTNASNIDEISNSITSISADLEKVKTSIQTLLDANTSSNVATQLTELNNKLDSMQQKVYNLQLDSAIARTLNNHLQVNVVGHQYDADSLSTNQIETMYYFAPNGDYLRRTQTSNVAFTKIEYVINEDNKTFAYEVQGEDSEQYVMDDARTAEDFINETFVTVNYQNYNIECEVDGNRAYYTYSNEQGGHIFTVSAGKLRSVEYTSGSGRTSSIMHIETCSKNNFNSEKEYMAEYIPCYGYYCTVIDGVKGLQNEKYVSLVGEMQTKDGYVEQTIYSSKTGGAEQNILNGQPTGYYVETKSGNTLLVNEGDDWQVKEVPNGIGIKNIFSALLQDLSYGIKSVTSSNNGLVYTVEIGGGFEQTLSFEFDDDGNLTKVYNSEDEYYVITPLTKEEYLSGVQSIQTQVDAIVEELNNTTNADE